MGQAKKEKNRPKGPGDGMANIKVKGENFYRSGKKAKQLRMFKEGKPRRNAAGEVTQAASYQSRDVPNARIEPNRKWFTNSRVISQDSLSQFRNAMSQSASDPYQVLLQRNKLPLSLIHNDQDPDVLKKHKSKMTLDAESFADTFGPKARRKRAKIGASNPADLAEQAEQSMNTYMDRLEQNQLLQGRSGAAPDEDDEYTQASMAIEPIFNKGQSKRIWNELFKLLDSSDVVVHVLDARDPEGTRCRSVEKYLREEASHKHLVFVLNKTDLVPTSVVARWVRVLSKERPTLAMRSSLTNPFGKGSLIELLRQFAKLHSNRKQISVGFIGYPNVGKSSIINTLRKKRVATVAPIPGETKVWQFVTLTRRIYLIDSPGVCAPLQSDTQEDILLRGVVRVENVENPEQYIPGLLAKVKPHHMEKTYGLSGWKDHFEFLELMARKSGRLLRGGEPDVDGVAKMVLNDFLRGKIPWYTPAPVEEGAEQAAAEDTRETARKRKRENDENTEDVLSEASEESDEDAGEDALEQEEDFEGFVSDEDAKTEVDAPSST